MCWKHETRCEGQTPCSACAKRETPYHYSMPGSDTGRVTHTEVYSLPLSGRSTRSKSQTSSVPRLKLEKRAESMADWWIECKHRAAEEKVQLKKETKIFRDGAADLEGSPSGGLTFSSWKKVQPAIHYEPPPQPKPPVAPESQTHCGSHLRTQVKYQQRSSLGAT